MKPQLWLITLIFVHFVSIKASDFVLPVVIKKPEPYKISITHKEMADRSLDMTANRLCDINQKTNAL